MQTMSKQCRMKTRVIQPARNRSPPNEYNFQVFNDSDDYSGSRVRIADDASPIMGGRLSAGQDSRRCDEAWPDDALQSYRHGDFIDRSGTDRIRFRGSENAFA